MNINLQSWLARRFRIVARGCRQMAAGAAIVAGGLVFVGTANGIEAIVNGSFEDASPIGWINGFGVYDHTTSVYYEGPAPNGSGAIYGWDPGIVSPPQTATQIASLAAGVADIDAGTASYDFSAWLSSWTDDNNYTLFELEWNDSSSGNGNPVGSPIVFDGNDGFDADIVGSADAMGDPDPGVAWTQDNWTKYQSIGTIPIGSRSAVVRYMGLDSGGGTGNDAYADLVSLDLPFETSPPTLSVLIDRDTRVIEIQNNTSIDQGIKGYSLQSFDGALIEENATFLADSDPNWVQFTAPGSRGDLSEGHLTTHNFADGGTINLSDSWLQYYQDEDDLDFTYLDANGQVVDGAVSFVGNGGASFIFADLNFDGTLDRDDWLVYAAGLGLSFPGLSAAESYRSGDLTGDLINDHVDFLAFKGAFDAVNGAGAFESMIAIPEPSTLFLSTLGFVVIWRRLCHRQSWRQ